MSSLGARLGFWLLLLSAGLITKCQGASPSDTLALSTPMEAEVEAPTATPLPTELPPTATLESVEVNASTAANANVDHVHAIQQADGSWTFRVTVSHPDTGWEDYADGWDVVLPDGTVLKPDDSSPFTRLLLHPHENEQPFTRSQSGLMIPADVTEVRVRAHDLVDGFGGKEVVVDLTVPSGPGFEVER